MARAETTPRRSWRLVLWTSALVALLPLLFAARTFWLEFASFRDPPSPVDHGPAHEQLPTLVEVSIPSSAGTLRGWFVPGATRAAVVLLHGSGGNRAELLPELEILTRAGLCGLAIDWPGQGESGGRVEWGFNEMAALRSAIDWLQRRPEVDPMRVGAFGFSLGSWIVLRVAATDLRLRAIAVAGAPASMVDFSLWDPGRGKNLLQWPAIFAMRARGMSVGTDEPMAIIKALSPRPVLVITGGEDRTVPRAMSEALFVAAGDPKELLAIPKAGHGEYARKGGQPYADRLSSFFLSALRAR